METSVVRSTFTTKPEDGLFELIHRAASSVAANQFDAGGMLEIRTAVPAAGSAPVLSVDAQFSDDGLRRTIATLDVHLHIAGGAPELTVLEEALTHFGGPQYTNVCFATPRAPVLDDGDDLELLRPRASADDAFDITIDGSSSLPFCFSNLALLAADLSSTEVEAAVDCLKQLGVSFTLRDRTSIRVTKFQLRGPVRASARAAAFVSLVRRGLRVSLYSATIPASQSIRIAWRVEPIPAGGYREGLDLCFSRGLAGTEGTSQDQVRVIEAFLRQHFSVEVGDGRWTVQSKRWTAADSESGGADVG